VDCDRGRGVGDVGLVVGAVIVTFDEWWQAKEASLTGQAIGVPVAMQLAREAWELSRAPVEAAIKQYHDEREYNNLSVRVAFYQIQQAMDKRKRA
jgi:hypothetical protein